MLNKITNYNDRLYIDTVLNNKNMSMKYSDTDTRTVTFREGLTQITSSALNLQKLEIADISLDNSDLRFLNSNLLNGVQDFMTDIYSFSLG